MIDNTYWTGKVLDKGAHATDVETRVVYESVESFLTDPRLDTHTL
jgi:hypothetical protein